MTSNQPLSIRYCCFEQVFDNGIVENNGFIILTGQTPIGADGNDNRSARTDFGRNRVIIDICGPFRRPFLLRSVEMRHNVDSGHGKIKNNTDKILRL